MYIYIHTHVYIRLTLKKKNHTSYKNLIKPLFDIARVRNECVLCVRSKWNVRTSRSNRAVRNEKPERSLTPPARKTVGVPRRRVFRYDEVVEHGCDLSDSTAFLSQTWGTFVSKRTRVKYAFNGTRRRVDKHRRHPPARIAFLGPSDVVISRDRIRTRS